MIYCVEDDDSIRELVVYTLQNSSYEAEGFDRGEPFFEALDQCVPELVLLDIMLPGEDGIQILKRLRTDLQPAHLREMTRMIDFEELPGVFDAFLSGQSRGRVVVKVNGG